MLMQMQMQVGNYLPQPASLVKLPRIEPAILRPERRPVTLLGRPNKATRAAKSIRTTGATDR